MKLSISTTIEESDYNRIERLVKADQSHVGLIVRKAVLKGLPLIEQEVLGEEFAGKNAPRSKRRLRLAAAA